MCLKDYFSSKTHTYCTVKKRGFREFLDEAQEYFFSQDTYMVIFFVDYGFRRTDIFSCCHFTKFRVLPEFAFLFFGRNFDDSGCSLAFLHNTDNPGLVSFLFLNVLAISCSLFTRQTNQKATGSLSRVTLQKLEHISACFCYCRHFGNNGQIVDDERDFVLLIASKSLSVSKKTKSSDISGSMSIVLVHQTSANAVQASHRVHTSLVGLTDILFTDNKFDAVPTFWLVKPLMGIDSHLGSKRFCQNKHISNNGGIRNDKFIRLANSGSNTSNRAPGVHDSLTSGHS